MPTARSEIVDVKVTRWYHCISKCVRSVFLMANGKTNRKQWIEERLQFLAGCFSISVGSFVAMDNHLHVTCRLDPDAESWCAEEVIRRWITVYPPGKLDLDDAFAVESWIKRASQNLEQVAIYRARLSDLGWFMKALKEPLARLANKEDGCKGSFWEARFKSIAILDEEALLMTSVYIDLNVVAAGKAETPEQSRHTSLRQRVAHFRSKGKMQRLQSAARNSVAGSRAIGDREQDHWLVPIEDRRELSQSGSDMVREGMVSTFSLGSYLLLVEYTGRLYREGKARISSGVQDVFARLGISESAWSGQVGKMLASQDLRGNYFGRRETLEAAARRRGKRIANLTPQGA